MKILVCIRQGLDGEINPFDACAYEEALKIKGAEVTIISMAPPSAKDFLLRFECSRFRIAYRFSPHKTYSLHDPVRKASRS